MIDKNNIKNNLEGAPLEHYMEMFTAIDPVEAAARCQVPYDEAEQKFTVGLLGRTYQVHFPDFAVEVEGDAEGFAPLRDMAYAKVLVARYLIRGRYMESNGGWKTFREIPGGELYNTPYNGQCIQRLAWGFGTKLAAFCTAMEKIGGVKLPMRNMDAAYQFSFLPGFDMQFMVCEPDDEFPPSAQILYSDNIPVVFDAEDLVKMGAISITTIKKI